MACVTAGFAVFAPQVWVLAREGFPAEIWPAEGEFVTVAGGGVGAAGPFADLPEAAQTRLLESGGRALLVDRGGEMLAGYGPDIDAETRMNSFSLVKSLVGALVLRAHADGLVPDLDVPLADYLGADAPRATLREALEMRSGLIVGGEPAKSVEDAGFSPFGPLARLYAFGLDATMGDLDVDPEAQGSFVYQSVNTALLGAVLEAVYDRPLPEILSEQIWRPAGAAEAYWRAVPETVEVSAYCCLYARPVDWVAVGRFLLDNGSAADPFLPEDLWHAWLLPQLAPEVRREGAYGWHLRHDVLDREGAPVGGAFAYFMGHGGQMLYLMPSEDLVVVRFGEQPQLLHSTLYDLF